LRLHLGIDRWLVFGGSWGAALALAYGIAHPERCLGFVLRGVFLARRWELDWFLEGMSTVHPEAGRGFLAFLPEAERGDPVAAYHRRLLDDDPAIHRPAARAWAAYENACSRFAIPGDGSGATAGTGSAAGLDPGGWAPLALARIECHYFRHAMFLDEGALLAGVGRIRHLPCVIVQGRYDLVCPPVSAFELAESWPGSRIEMVPDAGHSAMEPGIRRALVAATEELRERLDHRLATAVDP
jgi:proline iminopeptidase